MTKKFLIIGNPVKHSLSPKLHNYWFKQYKIDAIYEKKEILDHELSDVVESIRKEQIFGVNVTVPYKEKIIPFLDRLSELSEKTHSVNTIYKKGNVVIGDNTDIYGFVESMKYHSINLKDKTVLIIGGGGVVPSIINGLIELSIKKICLMNRTFKKIKKFKEDYPNIELLEWGKTVEFDIIINATSLGLKIDDKLNLDLNNLKSEKIFYDTIYNPPKTNFLIEAERNGHKIINGKLMLVYQAQKSFKNWIDIMPNVDEKFLKFLSND
tara:strand:+ start:684 stop:1484 length:801 start_codon:yes stop_codon:yes gene_type:complete